MAISLFGIPPSWNRLDIVNSMSNWRCWFAHHYLRLVWFNRNLGSTTVNSLPRMFCNLYKYLYEVAIFICDLSKSWDLCVPHDPIFSLVICLTMIYYDGNLPIPSTNNYELEILLNILHTKPSIVECAFVCCPSNDYFLMAMCRKLTRGQAHKKNQ